jgi:hypothetical protein
MATTNSPIILDKPEDWPIWIEDIRGLTPDDVWPLIDPDSDDHPAILKEPDLPEPKDVNATKTTFPELTSTERNVYDQMFKFYQASLERYKRQAKGLQDVKALIKARVSNARSVLLKGEHSVRQWLATLKEATSASEEFISYQAAQKYEEAIRKTLTYATVGKWLSTWEQAMVEAIKYNISEINSGRWLRDVAKAVKPLSDALHVKFVNNATNKDKNKPERYLEVSIKIREVIQTSDTSRKRVTRGTVLAAEFDGEPAASEDSYTEESKSCKTTKSGSRKRAGTTSALKDASKKKKTLRCKACKLPRHELDHCYYVFPELRFPGFEPVEGLVRKVARALAEDTHLAEEVATIRKERQLEKEVKKP